MKKRSDAAVEMFLGEANCAQSVLFAFCEELGLDGDTALKLACGFGAGMGRRQEVCGAVTGATMVIGLKHGRGLRQGQEAKETTYGLVRTLMDRFAERFGSVLCRGLLDGCDLATAAGQQEYQEKDLVHRTCAPCVRGAVEILEEIL